MAPRRGRDGDALRRCSVVTVTARTLVYEDAGLRERVCDTADVDRSVRFFLASRVRVSPLAVPASLLRTRVARGSADSFAARLRNAGVRDVRERDGGTRTAGREFLVTGGAFPTGVVGDGETAAALSALLSPSSYRADLAALMERTRATDSADRSEE